MKKVKQEKIYIDGWAVVFKADKRVFSATDGMGVFDNKIWAKHLAKIIGEQYVEIVPVSISFKI